MKSLTVEGSFALLRHEPPLQQAPLRARHVTVDGPGWHVAIDNAYAEYFGSALRQENAHLYFQSHAETLIKDESRTRISLIHATSGKDPAANLRFILKEYLYSPLPGLRTIWQMPKAMREYWGLAQCQALGIPAVTPAGFGYSFGLAGLLRSCFVLTVELNGAVDYRSWLAQGMARRSPSYEPNVHIMRKLGEYLRVLHGELFFLMRPSPKNVLLRNDKSPQPEPFFVDLAYARFAAPGLPARHAQSVDLGQFFSPLLRRRGNSILEPFFETYLPDPFGRGPEELRRLIIRAARIQSNRTPLSWLGNKVQRASVRRIRRAIRNGFRMMTDEEYRDERRERSRRRGSFDG